MTFFFFSKYLSRKVIVFYIKSKLSYYMAAKFVYLICLLIVLHILETCIHVCKQNTKEITVYSFSQLSLNIFKDLLQLV